jgi:hypothetical protein
MSHHFSRPTTSKIAGLGPSVGVLLWAQVLACGANVDVSNNGRASHEIASAADSGAVNTSEIGSIEERSFQGAVELFCREADLPSALDFYELAGFVVERRAGGFIALRREELYFYLNATPTVPEASAYSALPFGRGVTLRIITPAVDEMAARMADAGVPFESQLSDRYYGMREFSVSDPCGFTVRFAFPI